MKLEEVNFNIVKDTSTAINLYETNAVDRATLLAEFIDKYKGKPDFKTVKDTICILPSLKSKRPSFSK